MSLRRPGAEKKPPIGWASGGTIETVREKSMPETRAGTQTEQPSLLDAEVYDDCLRRIGRLAPDTPPRWGRMEVAQMLAHCAEVQEVMNGKPLEGTPWLFRLVRPLIKRAVLSRRPYPKGVKTHPQYLQRSEKHFEPEKRRLLEALAEFRASGAKGARHPLFGPLTPEEAGWGAFKHLDHHLRQFGA